MVENMYSCQYLQIKNTNSKAALMAFVCVLCFAPVVVEVRIRKVMTVYELCISN